jgi:outer membrane autotransporter protein
MRGRAERAFDPQQGVNGPSQVIIDSFTVQQDGTITYQLTPNNLPGSPGNPGDYPQIFADEANLGGTLKAVYLPGFYANQTVYEDIIVAGNTVGGANSFDQVTDNSIFLKTQEIYDGNTVDLVTTRTGFDALGGLGKNQNAVSGAIEKAFHHLPGPGTDPHDASPFARLIANLFTIDNAKDFQLLLDQLGGAQYAQYLQSVLWSLKPLNKSITDRMDCSLNLDYMRPVSPETGPGGCFTPKQWQAWVRAFGGWNNNDGDVNAPGYSEDQLGIWVGVDYAINDRWFFGVAGGYFDSNMGFDQWGGVNGGTIDYDGGQLALYGGWDNSVWYDRAIVSFGWYSGESHRNFALIGQALDLSGSPDSDVIAFYNELGRRFWIGASSTVTPFFGVGVAHAELDGTTESDPFNTGAALKVHGGDADSVSTVLGVRFNGTWGRFKPQLGVAWEHEFEDTFQTVNMAFAEAPGSNFKVVGTDLDEDSLWVEVGGAYALGPSSDISLSYVGRWMSDYDSQWIVGRFTYKFGAAPVPVAEPLKVGQ